MISFSPKRMSQMADFISGTPDDGDVLTYDSGTGKSAFAAPVAGPQGDPGNDGADGAAGTIRQISTDPLNIITGSRPAGTTGEVVFYTSVPGFYGCLNGATPLWILLG